MLTALRSGVQLVKRWLEAEGDFHAFLVLPETAQASAAVAILRAFSSLARQRASEVLNRGITLMHPWVPPFRHHTCLPCRGSRAECEQSCGSLAQAWITLGSGLWALNFTFALNVGLTEYRIRPQLNQHRTRSL